MKHPLDEKLQATLPVVAAPIYGTFETLDAAGQRLVLTKEGPFLEVRRAWLYARVPCGAINPALAMPYGKLDEMIDLPVLEAGALVGDFIANARAVLPNEVGGVVLWNEATRTARLAMCETLSASAGHLEYRRPVPLDGEHVVIDIHSHGHFKAGFSTTDDEDDRGATKWAMVVGNLDSRFPTLAQRLCLHGLLVDLT